MAYLTNKKIIASRLSQSYTDKSRVQGSSAKKSRLPDVDLHNRLALAVILAYSLASNHCSKMLCSVKLTNDIEFHNELLWQADQHHNFDFADDIFVSSVENSNVCQLR